MLHVYHGNWEIFDQTYVAPACSSMFSHLEIYKQQVNNVFFNEHQNELSKKILKNNIQTHRRFAIYHEFWSYSMKYIFQQNGSSEFFVNIIKSIVSYRTIVIVFGLRIELANSKVCVKTESLHRWGEHRWLRLRWSLPRSSICFTFWHL